MKKEFIITALLLMILSSVNVFADGRKKPDKSRKAIAQQRQNSKKVWDDTDIVHVFKRNKVNNLTVNTGSGNDTIKISN
jgi:hypothetical protein